MALILHIDTTGSTAFVSLAKDGILLAAHYNEFRNDHAAFLQPAIQNILLQQQLNLPQLDAIAVNNGPGSYTGLRVGLSSAKGLCYALNKPLLTVGSLPIIARAAITACNHEKALYIPMIDARRMEVFTAVYNEQMEEKMPPRAMILSNDSIFSENPSPVKTIFAGDGSQKFQNICKLPDAVFLHDYNPAQSFATLAFQNFNSKIFASIAYAEPLYVKEFYTGRQ